MAVKLAFQSVCHRFESYIQIFESNPCSFVIIEMADNLLLSQNSFKYPPINRLLKNSDSVIAPVLIRLL
jgi:hypothetical protein